jgi:hypothetical protein
MKLKVSRVDVWAASIEDRPGGLAEKLKLLAEAGANLEFIIARRAPDKHGAGVVFLTPLKGRKQIKAAVDAGFRQTETLHSVRIEGPDQQGLGARMTEALAASRINLRGFSAAAIGQKFICHLALDSAADAAKAIRILKNIS